MRHSIRIAKPFSYYEIIREAILSCPQEKATCSMIFQYITTRHPGIFRYSNSSTWKNNIRQILSKHPEFVKYRDEREGVQHFWTYVSPEAIAAEEDAVLRGRAPSSAVLRPRDLNTMQDAAKSSPWARRLREEFYNDLQDFHLQMDFDENK